MWLNVDFAMDHTMFAPAPKDWRSLVGMYHLKITWLSVFLLLGRERIKLYTWNMMRILL